MLNKTFSIFVSILKLFFSVYKLECINEKDTEYAKNISCYLRAIARGLSVLTSVSDLTTPLNYIWCNVAVREKSSANTFNTILMNNSMEICSSVGTNAAPIMKLILPLISVFAPRLFHPCPYEGRRVGVENIPIDLSLMPLIQLSNLPKGDYRTVMSRIYLELYFISIWILRMWAFMTKTGTPSTGSNYTGPFNRKRWTKIIATTESTIHEWS